MRLIDGTAFGRKLLKEAGCFAKDFTARKFILKCKDWLKDAPTIDAVEVVRCKDCKRCDGFPEKDIQPNEVGICKINMMAVKPDDFCSYGERKDK